jgi:hypothetical protein
MLIQNKASLKGEFRNRPSLISFNTNPLMGIKTPRDIAGTRSLPGSQTRRLDQLQSLSPPNVELRRLGICVNINCFAFHAACPSTPTQTRNLQEQQRITTMPREISFPTSNVTVRKDGAWVKMTPWYRATKPPGYDDLKPSGEYGRARRAGVPATDTNVTLREVTEEDVQSGRYVMNGREIAITTTA